MPTFKFTDPSGKQYTVNGPAGATEQEAFQILQAQLGNQAAPKSAAPTDDPSAVRTPPTTTSRAAAAAAGVNKGFFADLVGLPVDTAANVLDLLKAAGGSAYTAISGKPVADVMLPYDRTKVPGTSEWIASKLNDIGLGSAINNPNPEDRASRILHTGGRVAGASIVPNPNARISFGQNIANMMKGGASGIVGGAVGEVAPEWAGLAAMLPQAATATGAEAFRRGVRGGEAGRQAMVKRIEDLRAGGIDSPSVGLASGNKTIMGLENLMAQTPGSVGLYDTARAKNLAGMKAKIEQLRDQLSPVFGPVEAGSAIQGDLTGPFRERINATTRVLNDRMEQQVGSDFYTYPGNALNASGRMSAINPAAPATTEALVNKRIAGIAQNLASDVMGTPIHGGPLMNAPTRYLRADGQVLDVPPGIPFATLKNLRTSIGEEAGSNAIMGTPEQGQLKRLYGAMSADMREAVNAADRQAAGVEIGPLMREQQKGALALNRANQFYATAMDRADALNGIANRSAPEGAYSAVASSMNAGPSVYQRLRGVVSPETRQKIAATILDEMGTAGAGQQGAAGDTWSPRTFLTNYNRMDAKARTELFKRIPGGASLAQNLSSIARTAEMLGDSSKVWANPSGTAPALTARGTAYALTVGAFFQPVMAAGTATGLGLANQVSQRLLLNPKFVHWLARAPSVPPAQAQAYAQRLIANARLTNDKQLQDDVAEYLRSVEQGAQQVETDH